MSEVFAASKGISSFRSSSPLHRVTTTTRPAGSLHFSAHFLSVIPLSIFDQCTCQGEPKSSNLLLFTFIFNFVLERDPHNNSRPSPPAPAPPQTNPRSQPPERTRISTCGTLLCVSLPSASRAHPSCARSFFPSPPSLPLLLVLSRSCGCCPSSLSPFSPSPSLGCVATFPLASPPPGSPSM